MENISQIVCSDCGKQLDSGSARIFQSDSSFWEEVGWEKRKGAKAKTFSWGVSEIILCSICAEQFREKRLEDEWRFGKSYAVGAVLGLLTVIIIALIVLFLSLN